MKTVRAFGKHVDPVDYRRGFGVLGWWINVINHIRIFLERYIALRVLKLEGKKKGLDAGLVGRMLRVAKNDPVAQPWLGIEPPVMLREPRGLPRDPTRSTISTQEERTRARYGGGRQNHEPDRVTDESSLAVTLSAFERSRNRSVRYKAGRMHQITSLDGADYFEPVEDE